MVIRRNSITNFHEGLYALEIVGWSSDHTNTGTISFAFEILADCASDDNTISLPPQYPSVFHNVDISDPLSLTWAAEDIHHYMRTNETYTLPLYESSLPYTCSDLNYILDGQPSYVTLHPESDRLEIVFEGSTNSEWTGVAHEL